MIFIIVSEKFSQNIIPVILDIDHVYSIYIFSQNTTLYEISNNKYSKVKGRFIDIQSIYEAVKQTAKDYDRNEVSISLIESTDQPSKDNLNTLHCSFMYTQILKEILLTIEFNQNHINEFLTYCREELIKTDIERKNIDKIQNEYDKHEPIWWYTHENILYSIINRALRLMDVNIILKMGFFLRDVHDNINKLHEEQCRKQIFSESFIVYRGQGLSQNDFNQLKNMQGGLLAFNNFLSTSYDRDLSYFYADSNKQNNDMIGILFKIIIDSSISGTPFVDVKDIGYYRGNEKEILFSMHSVFRIGQMIKLDESERFWQIELIFTSDNDPQLKALTECMKQKTQQTKGWKRLALLLIQMGEFNKAEKLYDILLKQTDDQIEKAYLYHHIGLIKGNQGKYIECIEYYQKMIKIKEIILSPTHPKLATAYNNIGLAYKKIGEYSKALEYYKKSLDIREKIHPLNYSDLTESYNNIGGICNSMGKYSIALEYHEKGLEISEKILPENHPDLGTSYNNIGTIYTTMGEYSKALEYFKKTFEIFKKSLPPNHPDLATSYNNIGMAYSNMNEYSKALDYHEKGLEIRQKILPENHPDLATSYNSIGLIYDHMNKSSKALEYYQKSLEILKKSLPSNHPNLASSYNNIGTIYATMGEYSKTLEYYQKSLEIREKILPPNHPSLALSYNNIGEFYKNIGDYREALAYYKRSLNIWMDLLPSNHPYMKNVTNNIIFLENILK